jgi:tetratricopeptide (TPR) repeat protein
MSPIEPISQPLQHALQLLAQGQTAEAEAVVKKAALEAKAQHGSGSHPLALAYADIGRLHLRMGEFAKAAAEFGHASKGPLPNDAGQRRDRLNFMFGYAEALVGLTKHDEADKVLRQCITFAKSLHGPNIAAAIVANLPLANALLKAGKAADAYQLAQETYDQLWRMGDALIVQAIPVRAEALKAVGRADNPFVDLADLPAELAATGVELVLARAHTGDPGRMRAVLANLLTFADKKYGDGHAITSDVVAAIAHHETRQGPNAEASVRRNTVRRAIWSFAVRKIPGLLANLEVAFEPDGSLHLVPHLTREPNASETESLSTILTQAVDDLYARPTAKA